MPLFSTITGDFGRVHQPADLKDQRLSILIWVAVAISVVAVVLVGIGGSGETVLVAVTSAPLPGVKYVVTGKTTADNGRSAVIVKAIDEVTTQSWEELWITSEGGEMLRVIGISSQASWARDGSYCVATSSSSLELVRVDLDGIPRVTPLGIHGLLPKINDEGMIAFSDDGRMKVLVDGTVIDVSTKVSALGDCERWLWSDDGQLSFDVRMPGQEPRRYSYRF